MNYDIKYIIVYNNMIFTVKYKNKNINKISNHSQLLILIMFVSSHVRFVSIPQ